MKKRHICFLLFALACLLFVNSTILFAEDESDNCKQDPDTCIEDAALTIEISLSKVQFIKGALNSFIKLTDTLLTNDVLIDLEEEGSASVAINNDAINKIPYLDSDTQNYHFHNGIIIVKGTLYKSDMKIKQLEYELAKAKKEVSKKELQRLKIAYEVAHKEYKTFLNSNYWSE